MSMIKEWGKTLLGQGVVLKIRRGPLRGMRYRLNRYSSLSPLWGGWERDTQAIFEAMIQPGDCVYDLGANSGIHSMHCSRLVGAQGRVYAFEPMRFNLDEIELVKRLNRLDNLEVRAEAVGERAGRARFALGLHTKGGSLNPNHSATEFVEVEVVAIDELIRKGARAPDFVKIDIEGGEGMALLGMQEALSREHPSMYIELHSPEQDRQVGRILLEQGYSAYRVRSPQAQVLSGQQRFLAPIERLDEGFPHPQGVYGMLLAVHPARQSRWQAGLTRLLALA